MQQTVNEIDILIGVEKIDYAGEKFSKARGELIEWSRRCWKFKQTTKSTELEKENSSINQSIWAIIPQTFNEVKKTEI